MTQQAVQRVVLEQDHDHVVHRIASVGGHSEDLALLVGGAESMDPSLASLV